MPGATNLSIDGFGIFCNAEELLLIFKFDLIFLRTVIIWSELLKKKTLKVGASLFCYNLFNKIDGQVKFKIKHLMFLLLTFIK